MCCDVKIRCVRTRFLNFTNAVSVLQGLANAMLSPSQNGAVANPAFELEEGGGREAGSTSFTPSPHRPLTATVTPPAKSLGRCGYLGYSAPLPAPVHWGFG